MSRLMRDKTANSARETNYLGANGDRETFISSVQMTTSRIGSLTRLIDTLLCVTATCALCNLALFLYSPLLLLLQCCAVTLLLLLLLPLQCAKHFIELRSTSLFYAFPLLLPSTLGHLLWASDLDLEYYWIWCFSRIV